MAIFSWGARLPLVKLSCLTVRALMFLKRLFRCAAPPGVQFLHYTPDVPNLGDSLSSPKHYFTFTTDSSVLIVGGGAFNDLAVSTASRTQVDFRIAWAMGQSWPFDAAPQSFDERAVNMTYVRATTRDPLAETPTITLLPCVSVLHPIVDIPPGNEPGLFLNMDKAASGAQMQEILTAQAARKPGLIIGTNALNVDEFSALFKRTGEVTTNSYHIAYWSFLSGRKVRLIGYSTKFPDRQRKLTQSC